MMKKISLLTCLILLLGIYTVNALEVLKNDPNYADREIQPRQFVLKEQLSKWNGGLEWIELPCDNIRKLIGANEVINRRYRDSTVEFELYVAHWQPNNQYSSESLNHTPEGCFPAAGWRCDDGKSAKIFKTERFQLLPGEWRTFSQRNGQTQEVLFWCITDGKVRPFGNKGNFANVSEVISSSNFTSYVLRTLGITELPKMDSHVYFIRMNSNTPIENLTQNRMFEAVIEQLSATGLSEKIARTN